MSLIGLLKNKREQESLRSNGLNDPVISKPPTMFVQHSISRNGDSWQPMTMEMKMPTTFAVASHPEAKNYLQPQTTHPQCKQHEKVPSKSLLQQAFRNPAKSERKMDAIPSRIIPSTTQLQHDQMNYQTSPVDDYKLPEGAYYEEPPVFQLDPVNGNPMSFESSTPPVANNPSPTDASNVAQFQQSRCSDANCSNCNNSMK